MAEAQTANRAKDPAAFLYYSIVLTCLTVVAAAVIGTIQLLTLILNVISPSGRFWDGVQIAGDHYEVLGGGICGSFVIFGGLSVLCYQPWRTRVERAKERFRAIDGQRDNQPASIDRQDDVRKDDRPSAPDITVIDVEDRHARHSF
jgi:high-affinity nickel-transport protein